MAPKRKRDTASYPSRKPTHRTKVRDTSTPDWWQRRLDTEPDGRGPAATIPNPRQKRRAEGVPSGRGHGPSQPTLTRMEVDAQATTQGVLPDLPADALRRCVRACALLAEVHHMASTCRRFRDIVRDQHTWAGLWVDLTDVHTTAACLARLMRTWRSTFQRIGAASVRPSHLVALSALSPWLPVLLEWRYIEECQAKVFFSAHERIGYTCHAWFLGDALPPDCRLPLVTKVIWQGHLDTIAVGLTNATSIDALHLCQQRAFLDEDAGESDTFSLELRLRMSPSLHPKPGWVLDGCGLPIAQYGPWVQAHVLAGGDALEIGLIWSSSHLRIFADSQEVGSFDLRMLFPEGEHAGCQLRTFLHTSHQPDDHALDLHLLPQPVFLGTNPLSDAGLCPYCRPRRIAAVRVCDVCLRPLCRDHYETHIIDNCTVRGCMTCIGKLVCGDHQDGWALRRASAEAG